MRRFILLRVEDVSGSSGTGIVAHGVQGPNGWVVMFWEDSVKIFADTDTMMKVHAHGTRTRLHWQDPEEGVADKPGRVWSSEPPTPTKYTIMYLVRPVGMLVPNTVVRVTLQDGHSRVFYDGGSSSLEAFGDWEWSCLQAHPLEEI